MRTSARATLWQAMVERAEALNDAVVLGQRRATLRTAARIQSYAREISILANAVRLVDQPGDRHEG